MKHRRFSASNRQKTAPTRARQSEKWGLCPFAARLLIAGEILILLALCDFAARLNVADLSGSAGAIHRLSDIGGSLSASIVILVAATLGLDYMERQHQQRKK